MPPKQKTNPTIIAAKPFLKWAGSKRQLLKSFIDLYPSSLKAGDIKNYYEPFAGSGAVFFEIVQRYNIENAFLYDVNEDLVLTYKAIQAHAADLASVLYTHQQKYLPLDKAARLAYYYNQRENFNTQRVNATIVKSINKTLERAAQLIFLNRTCFNGLFRVNAKGEFNTPAGDYIKPTICDAENLAAVSKLLKIATIRKADFSRVLKDIKPASFVYFDPPYRPVSTTANFTAYSKLAFTDKHQAALAKVYRTLDKQGTPVMLSNAETRDNFFDDLYNGFRIVRVPAKRMINADASKRGYVNEIVVTNYTV